MQPNEQLLQFVGALYEPKDLVAVVSIENWDENGERQERVVDRRFIAAETIASHAASFHRLNGSPDWANVYFMVCPAANKGTKKADIVTLRALWVDVDDTGVDGTLERIHKAGMQEPTIVVSSGKGAHVYWKLEQPYDVSTDANRAKAEAVLKELRDLFGGDHVQNINRILRFPGFNNVKGARTGKAPTPCRIHSLELSCGFESLEEAIIRLPESAQLRIDALDCVKPKEPDTSFTPTAPAQPDAKPAPSKSRLRGPSFTDDEVIELAKKSKARGAEFTQLLAGSFPKPANENEGSGHSQADYRFVCMLAFYTKDAGQIDRIFHRSGLMRDKWDSKRNNSTYGGQTIARALSKVSEQYKPPRRIDDEFQFSPGSSGNGNGNGRGSEPTLAPKEKDPDSYVHSDHGNACRYLDTYGQRLRFTKTHGILVWDSKRWNTEREPHARSWGVGVVKAMLSEVRKLNEAGDEKRALALKKYERKCESIQRMRAVVESAELIAPGRGLFVADVPATFDQKSHLMNVMNGTIDLRTGELLPHDRKQLLTKLVPYKYDRNAKCPLFLKFLDDIFCYDREIIAFKQRSIGYFCTGSVRERCLFFWYGKGHNGKSTLGRLCSTLLGDYATILPTESLMVKRYAGIPNDIAMLRGARLALANETERGRQLAESLVKNLTGGEPITGRFLHKEHFKFMPEFKITMLGNHEPKIRSTDDGIWGRIHKIKFQRQFTAGQCDKSMYYRLRAEMPGILAWAVQGAIDWNKGGLRVPKSVVDATAAYRKESDTIGTWIEECCMIAAVLNPESEQKGGDINTEGYQEKGGDLYNSYAGWAKELGETVMWGRTFAESLESRGFVRERFGSSFWYGIQLNTEGARYKVMGENKRPASIGEQA